MDGCLGQQASCAMKLEASGFIYARQDSILSLPGLLVGTSRAGNFGVRLVIGGNFGRGICEENSSGLSGWILY